MESKIKILIVDDQEFERKNLSDFLKSLGHDVAIATDGKMALQMFESKHSDVSLVITDMHMPEMSGIELTQNLKKIDPTLDVIVITAQADIETAVAAIKAGATNYLTKPIKMEEVQLRVTKINEKRNSLGDDSLIARSACMKTLIAQLEVAAATDSNVLLTGETGVGKEVLSRFVHERSKRAKGPFIAINCSAIPENLLESEFFGHEKGAFTGADQRAIGLFERANGGTIFLDELGEMDLKLQPKILRAIEGRSIRRVSGTADIKIDVRIIAATNRDLKKNVDDKLFREDLYFRLNVIHAEIPPLRERQEDIPALVDHMVRTFTARMGIQSKGVDDSYVDALKKYAFPGNVRELSNIIERSLIFSNGSTLTGATLPPEVTGGGKTSNSETEETLSNTGPLNESLAQYEKKLIENRIAQHQGDLTLVASELKISRSSLYSKMSKYNIKSK